MTTDRHMGRVYAGVDGSLGSMRALREAAVMARQRRAELHVVHVRRPAPITPVIPFLIPTIPDPPRAHSESVDWRDAAAMDVILTCLQDALGVIPAGLEVRWRVLVGDPHRVLATLGCRDDDLLVIGAGGGRRHRLGRRSVGRYCLTHSRCPVLVAPPAEFARVIRRAGVRRRLVPRDPWRDFDAVTSREVHPAR